MIGVVLTPLSASAADSDGDTVDDSLDDCPHAAGTSTIDKTGCPDRDGDGYSDTYDGWTSNNPNFGIEQQITGSSHYSVDHNSDGSLLATANGRQIRIFDTSTHTNVRSSAQLVEGNNGYITSIDWSPDDAYIAATLSDDTATILHASNLTIVHEDITHSGSSRTFSDVAFFPNSTSIAVVDEASGGWGGGTCSGCAVMLIDVATGSIWREVKPAGNSGSYSSVAFSEDGSRMAVGGDGNAYLINTSAWTTVRAMNPGSGANVHSIDISPDGNTIAMCTGYDNGVSQLRAFRTSDGASILSKTGTSSCYGVDVSPDSNQVAYTIGYYSTNGGTSVIYEIQSGTLIDTLSVARGSNTCSQSGNSNPCGNVNSASWHPDG
ncbi:MAG: WD40 repeat domain-containing protein, partial [Candidatus Poseidoniaceae archaeon]